MVTKSNKAPEKKRRQRYTDDTRVVVLRANNPKRAGSRSAMFWTKYRNNMKIKALLKHFPSRALMISHLHHDVLRGHIRLETAANDNGKMTRKDA